MKNKEQDKQPPTIEELAEQVSPYIDEVRLSIATALYPFMITTYGLGAAPAFTVQAADDLIKELKKK